jgi:hypothetical protein
LPGRLRWSLSKAFDELKARNLVEPPSVQPEVRHQLIEVYRQDILKLEELLHRDLSGWLA